MERSIADGYSSYTESERFTGCLTLFALSSRYCNLVNAFYFGSLTFRIVEKTTLRHKVYGFSAYEIDFFV